MIVAVDIPVFVASFSCVIWIVWACPRSSGQCATMTARSHRSVADSSIIECSSSGEFASWMMYAVSLRPNFGSFVRLNTLPDPQSHSRVGFGMSLKRDRLQRSLI